MTAEEIADLELRVRLELALRKFRNTRKKQGLSQKEVAKKANLPRTTISKIETGYQNVSIYKVMQFARALNKDIVIELVDRKKASSARNTMENTIK